MGSYGSGIGEARSGEVVLMKARSSAGSCATGSARRRVWILHPDEAWRKPTSGQQVSETCLKAASSVCRFDHVVIDQGVLLELVGL